MHIKNKDNKNNYQTIKELADNFFQLEEKYGLVDLNVSGVKVWQCIRCKLFTSMAAEVFNLGIAHDSRASSLGEIISMLCNSLRSSSLLGGSHDIVVFPHQRVRLVEGRYIDINTESFVGELLSENRDILVLERPYAKTHLAESNEYTKYLDDSIIFTHLFVSQIIRLFNVSKDKTGSIESPSSSTPSTKPLPLSGVWYDFSIKDALSVYRPSSSTNTVSWSELIRTVVKYFASIIFWMFV